MTKNFNEDLKELSIYVYQNGKQSMPEGWQKIYTCENPKSGFYGEAYKKGDEIAVVYRGTDFESGIEPFKKDLIGGDIPMARTKIPEQYNDALKMYKDIESKYSNKRIVLSGHSLGGSLAQLVSAQTGRKAVTFNAYGTGDILAQAGVRNQRLLDITNYGHPKDPVFISNVKNQPGTIYYTNTNLNPEKTYSRKFEKISKENFKENLPQKRYHNIEYMDKTENSIKVENSPMYTKSSPALLKGSVSYDAFDDMTDDEIAALLSEEDFDNNPYSVKSAILAELKQPQESKMQKFKEKLFGKKENSSQKEFDETKDYSSYKNEVTNSDIIFTQEDIDSMTESELKENEKAINYQKKTIGIPSQKQAKASGLVHVTGYTRADGTKVRSYYRARPA